MDNKITISLDPSINNTGFAVFKGKELIDYGIIKTKRKDEKPSDKNRLINLHRNVRAQIDYAHSVESSGIDIIIEDFQIRHEDSTLRNFDSLKKLLFAIGTCICASGKDCEVYMTKPLDWKGSSSKENTKFAAKSLYKISGSLDHNAADAIMIGHSHINKGSVINVTKKQGRVRRRFSKKDIERYMSKK